MPLRPEPLPQDVAQLSRIILSLDAENADLKARVTASCKMRRVELGDDSRRKRSATTHR